jgi:5-methylcytosine-specific restriction protein B
MDRNFESAISEFSFPEEQQLLALREEFVRKFPVSSIPDLTLERYALGIEPKKESFCYWLEYKTEELGKIGGVGAITHIVFYSKKQQKWIFEERFPDERAAFQSVKDGIIQLLQLAGENKFDEVEKVVPYVSRNITRGKILSLYFPDKFLPIFSISHLKDLCLELDIVANTESQVQMNQALLRFKQSRRDLHDWSNLRFAKFLYAHFEPGRQYWKIAPGEKARYWQDCVDGGYICIGWDAVGDMEQYKTDEAFRTAFEKFWPNNKGKWREVWDFSKNIRMGDTIIANNGMTSVVAVGKATGEYFFNSERNEYKNCIRVEWENTQVTAIPEVARDVVSGWGLKTVKKLSREDYQNLMSGHSIGGLIWKRDSYQLSLENPAEVETSDLEELYSALVATAPSSNGIDKDLKKAMEVWIKAPETPLQSETYVLLSNWFLSDATHAKSATGEAAGRIWDSLFRCRPKQRLSYSNSNDVVLPERFEEWWAEQARLQGSSTHESAPPNIQSMNGRYGEICRKTYLRPQFFEDCERLLVQKKQIILQGAPGTGKTFVATELAELWAGSAGRVKTVQFHESYGYEDFVFGIKPRTNPETGTTAFNQEEGIFIKVCEEARNSNENHVLVIDEINRAKTARVFGELLYLLEYREKDVELQSGRSFSIPENLYIIGTMNTLDKSIALVDYALRRRFAFVGLNPVQNGASTVLQQWLVHNKVKNADEIERLFVALNQVVSKEGEEALMIGHSYFMQKEACEKGEFTPEMLSFLWEYYILPLVAEYNYQLGRKDLEKTYGLEAIRERANA